MPLCVRAYTSYERKAFDPLIFHSLFILSLKNWLKAGGKIVFSVVCLGADSQRGDGSEMYSIKAYREVSVKVIKRQKFWINVKNGN